MGILGKALNRIRSTLASEPDERRRSLAKGVSIGGAPTAYGRDAYQVFGFDPASAYVNIENDLISRYVDYEDMDDIPEVATSLNILADETTQDDYERRTPIWVQSPDRTVQDILDKDLLRTRLRFPEDEAWDCARTLYKYGNVFYEHLYDESGVVGLNYLPPATMRRIEGPKADLYGFIQDFRGKYGYTPNEWEALYKARMTQPEEDTNKLNAGWNRVPRRAVAFEPWEILHLRLRNRSRKSIYGVALLEGGRWIAKRLNLLEDSALIYRLQRAPERFAFYVDVGDLPPSEAMAYVNRIRQQYRKKKFFDPQSGKLNLRWEPLPVAHFTPIPLMDGRTVTIKEMAEEHKAGKKHWVYSVDRETGKMVPGEVSWVGHVRANGKALKITFDDGGTATMAPDHPLMLRDRSYKNAEDIRPGDSVMPLYRKISSKEKGDLDGYERIYLPEDKKYQYTHRLVADALNLWESGDTIHHKNFNKLDNDPSNLEGMLRRAHIQLYAKKLNTRKVKSTHRHMIRYFLRDAGFESFEAFKNTELNNNHKVVSVEEVEPCDHYCMTVEKWHNFALLLEKDGVADKTSGIFVKNTSDEDFFIPVRKGREGARVEVLGAPQWQCLVGETEIPLLNGKSKTIQEMAEEGGSHWVYSSTVEGRIVPGRAHSARVSHESAEIWEVELDNGEVVKCTGNHPFLMRDGQYVLAENLKPNDSLMPLYRQSSSKKCGDHLTGYERVYHPETNKWGYTHHAVYDGNPVNEWRSGKIIHHKDHNKRNNDPDNLVSVSRKQHSLEHRENANRLHTPEVLEKIRITKSSEAHKAKLRAAWEDPSRKAAHKDMMIRRMSDASQKKLHGGIIAEWNKSEERRERMTGKNHPKWVDLTVEQLGEKLRNSGARTMTGFIKSGGVSQGTIERILGTERLRWADLAVRFIPDWKPRGRAASKQAPEYVGRNHKVVSVRNTGTTARVYDLTVDEHHNFAIGPGVFVHNSMEDINYFKEKLFAAMFVPRSYLAQEAGVTRQILTNQDVTVARIVMGVQRIITNAVSRTCRVHMSAIGMDPYAVPYSVHMAVPNSIYELAQLEVMNARAAFATEAQAFVSEYWILNKIFHFEDDDIQMIMQQKHDDVLRNSNLQTQAQVQNQMQMADLQSVTQTQAQLSQVQVQQAMADPKAFAALQQQNQMQQQQMAQAMSPQQAEDVDRRLRRVTEGFERPMGRIGADKMAGRYSPKNWEASIMRGDRAAERRAEGKLDRLLANDAKLSNRLTEVRGLLEDLRSSVKPRNGNG